MEPSPRHNETAIDRGASGAISGAANVLQKLSAIIRERRAASADASYTRQLLDAGVPKCAKKLGEEAVETVIAALGDDDAAFKAEVADLVYHLLVLLEARGTSLDEVLAVLDARLGLSGLAEKAARNTSIVKPG
jgi:phosphoribosyl-ATP pyrophosphohydrolase